MLSTKLPKVQVGVVIGRFQVPMLHEGYYQLLDTVQKLHPKFVILIGIAEVPTTNKDPLDFEMRSQMLRRAYPNAIILPIKDHKSDEIWSKNVDKLISSVLLPNESVILYGSRNSFINSYRGNYSVQELQEIVPANGTEIREKISVLDSPDFRAGIIWATLHRFKNPIPTVDIIIFNPKHEYLLIQKPEQKQWMFPGGFTELNSESDEQDARREVMEETNVEVGTLRYLFSMNVSGDWRYKNLDEKIRTHVFEAPYIFGQLKAGGDDVEGGKVQWVPQANVHLYLDPVHIPLWEKYIQIKQQPTITA